MKALKSFSSDGDLLELKYMIGKKTSLPWKGYKISMRRVLKNSPLNRTPLTKDVNQALARNEMWYARNEVLQCKRLLLSFDLSILLTKPRNNFSNSNISVNDIDTDTNFI